MKKSNEKMYEEFSLNLIFEREEDRENIHKELCKILEEKSLNDDFHGDICIELENYKTNEDHFNRDCKSDGDCGDYIIYQTVEALRKNNGCISAAADDLGISRSALYRRIKKFEITEDDWREEEHWRIAEMSVKDATIKALSDNCGNVAMAADDLGVATSTIYRRIKRFGLIH